MVDLPLPYDTLVTSCTYSSSFSIAHYSCWSPFLYRHKFLRHILFYDFHIIKSPFQMQFDLGKWIQKSYMVHGGEDMEVAALVQFCLWLRGVAQTETSALVRCCGGFANPLMTTFLVTCGILHHGDATDIINNHPYLLLNPLEWTYDTQHHLDRRRL